MATPIRNLSKTSLTSIVKRELTHSEFTDMHIWDGMITDDELKGILYFVNSARIDTDAKRFLNDTSGLPRESASYLVSGLPEDYKFEVVNTQVKGPSPHGLLAHIFRYDLNGNEVRQLTIEGFH